MIGWKTTANFLSQWCHVEWWRKFCAETLKKVNEWMRKYGFKKDLHTVFLVQFGINLHLWVFQKGEIARAEAARSISAFWKTHSCKLILNWTRNRVITYTNTWSLVTTTFLVFDYIMIITCSLPLTWHCRQKAIVLRLRNVTFPHYGQFCDTLSKDRTELV